MVHLASPWSSYRSTIHPHLHFWLFLQISDVSQVSGPLWVRTVVLTLFIPLPPSCQPPMPTRAGPAPALLSPWHPTSPCPPPMPNRPAVTSPELKLSPGGLFQADRRLHRKAAYLIIHQSSLVLCFFWSLITRMLRGKDLQRACQALVLARVFWVS